MRLNSSPIQLYNWLDTKQTNFENIHPFIHIIGFLITLLDLLKVHVLTGVRLCLHHIDIMTFNKGELFKFHSVFYIECLNVNYVNLYKEICSMYNYCVSLMSIILIVLISIFYFGLNSMHSYCFLLPPGFDSKLFKAV